MTLSDLYDDYEDLLWRYAQRLTHDSQQADDLVQETFIRAMPNMSLLDMLKPYQQQAWLKRTLKNLFLDDVRRQQRRETLVEQLSKETPVMGNLPQALGSTNPFDLVPEQYKDVFDMRYRLGMNSTEIAEELDLPAATVRSRIHLGMKQLRSQKSKLL